MSRQKRKSSENTWDNVKLVTESALGAACLTFSQAHLSTLDCGEGKYSVYLQGAQAKRTKSSCSNDSPPPPNGFQGRVFKSHVREAAAGSWSACAQFPSWLASRFCTSSVFRLQPVWGLCAWGQPFSSAEDLTPQKNILGMRVRPSYRSGNWGFRLLCDWFLV